MEKKYFFTIATGWVLRSYCSGAVPQENILNKEDQVNNHCYLERAVPPSLLGPRWNMKSLLVKPLLVKPSSWPKWILLWKKHLMCNISDMFGYFVFTTFWRHLWSIMLKNWCQIFCAAVLLLIMNFVITLSKFFYDNKVSNCPLSFVSASHKLL